MISFQDAESIVHASVSKRVSREFYGSEDRLSDLGVSSNKDLENLSRTIGLVASSFRATVDLKHLSTLAANATLSTLVNALQLSARKLCSNPTSPHEQPCCPYPKICQECDSPVL